MKTGTLLIICLASIYINTNGQNFSGVIITNLVPQEKEANEKLDPTPGNNFISPQKKGNTDKLTTPFNYHAYYLQKSKIQKLKGIVLVSGGSLASFFGIRSGLNVYNDHSLSNNPLFNNRNKYSNGAGLALTGLFMVAGSIPYFLNSFKYKKMAVLKLTCQKTSFGASNKSCKKVTGLTFSIPVGK
jgi:hypothetical protein